jgi:tellurite resistance protein
MARQAHYLWEVFGAPRDTDPRPDQYVRFGKASLVIAGADGELAPEELEYFLGMVSAYGAPESALEEFRKFDYRKGKLEDFLKPGDEVNGRMLVYDAIRVAHADGSYHPLEREATAKMAKLAGVDEVTLQSIESLVASELAIRQLRIALLQAPQKPTQR